MIDEIKTLTQWTKDQRCPLKKQTMWIAINDGRLKATKPIGSRVWLLKWSDLENYINGK